MLLALILTAWPASDAELKVLELPAGKQKLRVFIDAGHGAPGNEGNHGCFCQLEQDHTLRVANQLAMALAATGRFEVKRSRVADEHPKYQERIAAAEAFKADVIISLHSDARGEAQALAQRDAGVCWANPDEPGFSVLWNDEGPAFPEREKLGRAVGAAMREAGFLPYTGINYGDLYRHDEVEPAGWIDKRPLTKRVYFLRGSGIPTVIIETHHALDVQEVGRWDQPATLEAFASAVGAAILRRAK